ncbi:MAG: hypothetical protein MR837_02590 [Firmicutes bacterium]|nr:hypothetical protein [Bacillota bacterium]
MKKIIATVLAMVMALALCTTAFADTTYTAKYTKDGTETKGDVTVTDVVAKKATATTPAGIKGYLVENKHYVAADASDYDLKLTANDKATLYLKEAPNDNLEYAVKAKAYTNLGEECEKLNVPDTTVKYYVYTDDDNNSFFYQAASAQSGDYNVLVDGKLVSVTYYGTDDDLVKHTWKVNTLNDDKTVATYKCKDCGVVATVYKTKDAAEAAGATVVSKVGDNIIGWGGAAKPADTDKNSSPKTFDAGIAMYVGMALTSVAGSAVVIGKKKEF